MDLRYYGLPKNETGNPTLEKTVREAAEDTGKYNGSALPEDGYAHNATASSGDAVEYQIISKLPTITSQASFLSDYTFVDTLSKGLSYNRNDVVLEFFTDEGCTNSISIWKQTEATMADGTIKEIERPLSHCPRKVVGNALLSGNVFCGHCGGRIFASTARKSHHATKIVNERIPIYKCYNRTQHKGLCNGPTSYRAYRVDQVVEELLTDIFTKAKGLDENAFLRKQVYEVTQEARNSLRHAKAERLKAEKELGKWEALMLDSIEGKCVFTSEQIKRRMDGLQEKMSDLNETVGQLERKIEESAKIAEEIRSEHRKLLSWADLYQDASMPERKMVASNLIKAVFLSENYGISIELNISEEQYRKGLILE